MATVTVSSTCPPLLPSRFTGVDAVSFNFAVERGTGTVGAVDDIPTSTFAVVNSRVIILEDGSNYENKICNKFHFFSVVLLHGII